MTTTPLPSSYSWGKVIGRVWTAKLDHTTHAGWAPSAATHAVWTDVGTDL